MKNEQARLNGYGCKNCEVIFVTIDVDKGVTPFMIGCKTCDGMAYSHMYQVPDHIRPTLKPTHEWYLKSSEDRHLSLREITQRGLDIMSEGGSDGDS